MVEPLDPKARSQSKPKLLYKNNFWQNLKLPQRCHHLGVCARGEMTKLLGQRNDLSPYSSTRRRDLRKKIDFIVYAPQQGSQINKQIFKIVIIQLIFNVKKLMRQFNQLFSIIIIKCRFLLCRDLLINTQIRRWDKQIRKKRKKKKRKREQKKLQEE
ncbi:hypothetical protein pb186bvf_000146 [Paramecium bursaria]